MARAPAKNATPPVVAKALKALKKGQAGKARRLLADAARKNPGDGELFYLLATATLQDGDPGGALEHVERALTLPPAGGAVLPAGGRYHTLKGEALYALGRVDEAVEEYRRALALEPGQPEAEGNLGLALSHLGWHGDAVGYLQSALRRRPDTTAFLFGLGWELVDWGDMAGAESCLAKLRRQTGDNPRVLCQLGRVKAALGQEDEARNLWEQAVALARSAPSDATAETLAEILAYLGGLEMTLGRAEAAVERQEQALAADSGNALAHFNLAHMAVQRPKGDKGEESEARLEEIEAALDKGRLCHDAAAQIHFAAGKTLADLGRADAAFEHYRQGNAMIWGRLGVDPQAYVNQTHDLTEVFGAPFFDRDLAPADGGRGLIFIVGMPRSGTTLVEQILGAHPEVVNGGERGDIPLLTGRLAEKTGDKPFPHAALDLDRARAGHLAADHLAATRRLAGEKCFTDKTPANFLRLGLIAALFPQARIIHCRRHPLDTCLSCYFQLFGRNAILYSYDLETLGLYYRLYRELMDHWRRVLPNDFLEVDYEHLVGDQEAVSRRIVGHCGLPWDEACLRFHDRQGSVKTASQWQVRQPLYGTSIDRWRAYDKHLAPLKTALAGNRGRIEGRR